MFYLLSGVYCEVVQFNGMETQCISILSVSCILQNPNLLHIIYRQKVTAGFPGLSNIPVRYFTRRYTSMVYTSPCSQLCPFPKRGGDVGGRGRMGGGELAIISAANLYLTSSDKVPHCQGGGGGGGGRPPPPLSLVFEYMEGDSFPPFYWGGEGRLIRI